MVLNFYLHCVYRVYSRLLMAATIAFYVVHSILKKIFSAEIDRNDIYLGGATKQNGVSQKICPKNAIIPPNVQNRLWFKVGLSPSKKNLCVCFIESPINMMKNAFCFIFVLKIFNVFIMTFRSSRKNDLIRKIRLISKFITLQPGEQIVQYLSK